jgi:hypothetical protein
VKALFHQGCLVRLAVEPFGVGKEPVEVENNAGDH